MSDSREPPIPPGPPEQVLGDFYLHEKIGAGSMGVVYRAQQISKKRPAAVKILYREKALQPDFVERFYREAALMARLQHPNLIRCFRAGREKGQCYFGMEFVEGLSLRSLMERRKSLPLGNILYLIRVCAEALDHAHKNDVIHRDIKPTNLLLTWSGLLKIADMGLARSTDVDAGVTLSGVGMGTPEYISPEQARDARSVDHRTDIYALGIVLYELLTGQLPFRGPSAVEMVMAKEQTFFIPASRLNPQVSPELDQLLRTLLQPDPARRCAGCSEILKAIDRLDTPTVPLNPGDLGIEPPTSITPPPASASGEILVVHQGSGSTTFVQQVLDKLGYKGSLQVVGSSEDTVSLLQSTPLPRVIVVTVPLPASGGKEMFAALRDAIQRHRIPVVILAGTTTARAVLQAYGLRVCTRVTQPEGLLPFERLLPA